MDENSGNRFGRTIWTVWGYLSGAVARYLRPEVANGNQNVSSSSNETDLKSTEEKINKKLKSNDSEKEDNMGNENTEVKKCSLPEVRVQSASVQWENTDVDDSNVELHVDTTNKQAYHFAVWSTGTNNGRSTSGDTDSSEHKGDEHAEKEPVLPEQEVSESTQEVEETGEIGEKYGNDETKGESTKNYEDEKCALKEDVSGNANMVVRTELHEQDVEQEQQMYNEETEGSRDFKDGNECFLDEKGTTKSNENQGTESQVQDLLLQDYSTEEAGDILKLEGLNTVENKSEVAEFSKREADEMMLATKQDKESETAQELEEPGQTEPKNGNIEDEKCQDHEDENCANKQEDPDSSNIMVQSELKDYGETEAIAGFEHADKCHFDKMEKNVVDQKIQEKTEEEEDQDPESDVQDLLPQQEYSTEEADDISKPVKVIEQCCDKIAELAKNEVEMIFAAEQDKENKTEQELEEICPIEQKDGNGEDEDCDGNYEDEMKNEDPDNADLMVQRLKVMEKYHDEKADSVDDIMLAQRQDENTTESEQDKTKSELICLEETLQSVSEEIFEKNVKSGEMELKVVDEIFYSKQDTPKNTPETGTGSPVAVRKNEGLFSDLIVCEFPGELKAPEAVADFTEVKTNLHELQTFGEQHLERETVVSHSVEHCETLKALEEALELEQDIETQMESLSATESEMFAESVELSTEHNDETMETEISSEDKRTEHFKTESELSIMTNATVQPHELNDITEAECQPSQGAINTFSESLGHLTETDKTEHVAEEQPQPVLLKSLSPVEFLEESVDLLGESEGQEITETDLLKTALQFVEEITNQVLKEMVDTEVSLVQETETSAEELGDTECVSMEEERMLLSKTMDIGVEKEAIFGKQIEQAIHLPEFGCQKQQTTAMLSTGTDNAGCISDDTADEEHNDVEKETFPSKENQTERLCAKSECRESETRVELEKAGEVEQKDSNNEKCDGNLEDETYAMNREDPDITGVIIQSQEQPIDITDHGEQKGHADEHLVDEKQETIVEQKDEEKTKNSEDREPELQAPADVVVLEERRLDEPMETEIEMETKSGEVKQHDQNICSPECDTTDGHHEQIQKIIGGKSVLSSYEELMEVSKPVMKRGFDHVNKEHLSVKTGGKLVHPQAFKDSSLDFTVQKSRIAVKNPLVRPPKDPRKLLSKASVEPLLPKPSPSPRVQITVPNKGVIGFKLPGLGAQLPVLRKTEFGKKVKEGAEAENTLQPQQKSVAVPEDSVKQEQTSAKPKWTPPRHPGMGSPLMMAELKNKLKKPVND